MAFIRFRPFAAVCLYGMESACLFAYRKAKERRGVVFILLSVGRVSAGGHAALLYDDT